MTGYVALTFVCSSSCLGYFCTNTTVVPEICPTGYICPEGTRFAFQFSCPEGTFNNDTGGWIHRDTEGEGAKKRERERAREREKERERDID